MKKLKANTIQNYNLSFSHFSKLIGVDSATVNRYFIGKCNNFDVIRKIEIGGIVLEELGLEWPSIKYIPSEAGRKQYAKNKKVSDRLDKKFATAYKRALKKAEKQA